MFMKYVLVIFLCLVSSSSFAADSTSFNPVTMTVTPTVTPQAAPPIQGELCNWVGWRKAVNAAYVGGTFVCDAYSDTFQSYCSGGIITQTSAVRVCSSSHDTAIQGETCNWAGWRYAVNAAYVGGTFVCDAYSDTFQSYCTGGIITQTSAVRVCSSSHDTAVPPPSGTTCGWVGWKQEEHFKLYCSGSLITQAVYVEKPCTWVGWSDYAPAGVSTFYGCQTSGTGYSYYCSDGQVTSSRSKTVCLVAGDYNGT